MSPLRHAFEASTFLRDVRPPAQIAGLLGSSRSLVAAALASLSEAPVVVLVADERRLGPAVSDLLTFLRALGDEREVLPFPAFALDPYRGMTPHLDVVAARLTALVALAEKRKVAVVSTAAAILYRTAIPRRLQDAVMRLGTGDTVDLRALELRLTENGYRREDPVTTPGDFARRGGIVDVFSPDRELPYRLEFVGEELEEIRSFDPGTQRGRETLPHARLLPGSEWAVGSEQRAELETLLGSAEAVREALTLSSGNLVSLLPRLGDYQSSLFDYVDKADGLFLAEEPAAIQRAAEIEWERVLQGYDAAEDRTRERLAEPSRLLMDPEELDERIQSRAVALVELAVAAEETHHLSARPFPSFRGRLAELVEEVKKSVERYGRVQVFVASEAAAERAVELFADAGLTAGRAASGEGAESRGYGHGHVTLELGELSSGFAAPELDLAVFTGADVFSEPPAARKHRRARFGQFLSDFRDLKLGDYVVHTEHGIGVFAGLTKLEDGGGSELVVLEYQGGDKLYVPVDRLDLLEKYSSSESKRPRVDTLGGSGWERVKKRVRKSMRNMAAELLKLYAARKASAGHAFGPDTAWMREFESLFEFDETPDQLQAIEDVKRDMEASFPMDRLLCGDVGYGKTEVAMRAAFKAVSDGKQVAVLVPTTVLAFQHLTTFTERFGAFPVRIEMLSRFRSRPEQKQVLEELADGKVDVIIGTHRLLSKDVHFLDLGLLVVDEEQRFGVAHKEKLKKLRAGVDALAMSATPIPRSLHMSLSGIRDLSVIETPPKDRMSIQTQISRMDAKVLTEAIRYELGRGGQVYFVHNRIGSIYSMANYLARLVPEARIAVAHGQMKESELERVMLRFIRQEFDVLVSTTIIENGLDIPLVNTLVVNRADRYGLSQLYQLRGRVGRSNRRAYAYLLVPEEGRISPLARRRLAAIREFSELGAGFRIAALDLELRGAGNLLGGEQHGHIDAVGFDLYCRLLDEAVGELEGVELPRARRAALNLRLQMPIPESFVADTNQRMSIYKRASSAPDLETLKRLEEETRDRFGPLPESVLRFFEYARLSVMADGIGLESIERERGRLALRWPEGAAPAPATSALGGIGDASIRREGGRAVLVVPLPGSEPLEVLSTLREALRQLERYSKMS